MSHCLYRHISHNLQGLILYLYLFKSCATYTGSAYHNLYTSLSSQTDVLPSPMDKCPQHLRADLSRPLLSTDTLLTAFWQVLQLPQTSHDPCRQDVLRPLRTNTFSRASMYHDLYTSLSTSEVPRLLWTDASRPLRLAQIPPWFLCLTAFKDNCPVAYMGRCRDVPLPF